MDSKSCDERQSLKVNYEGEAGVIYTIDDILERLTRIENKIDRILSISETDGKKMVDHIDFVESVYDQVKSPFTYLMDRISEFTGQNEVENEVLNEMINDSEYESEYDSE
jgi:hypothetical protein